MLREGMRHVQGWVSSVMAMQLDAGPKTYVWLQEGAWCVVKADTI